MKRTATALAAVLALAGCVTQLPPTNPVPITQAMAEAIVVGVRAGLKDPESANFGHTVAGLAPSTGEYLVCGYVNAKNSFGGYTGMQIFIGTLRQPGGFTLTGIGNDQFTNDYILTQCQGANLFP